MRPLAARRFSRSLTLLALPFLAACADATPPPVAPSPAASSRSEGAPKAELTMDDVIASLGAKPPEPIAGLALAKVRDPVAAAQRGMNDTTRLQTIAALPNEGVSFSSTAPQQMVDSLQLVYARVALLEPVALGPKSATSIDAVCQMDGALSVAASARGFAKMAESDDTPRAVREIVEAHIPWLDKAEEMRGRYRALAIRQKTPAEGCFLAAARDAMKLLGRTPEARKKIVALFAERVGDPLRASDHLDLALLHVLTDEPALAEAALGRARAALSRTPSEDGSKRLAHIAEDVETLKKLAALPASDTIGRADLLLLLDRNADAKAVLEAAEPVPPRTVRAAARLALIAFQDTATRDGITRGLVAASDEMRDAKNGPHDETVASVALGLEGAHLVEALQNGTVIEQLKGARPRLDVLTTELAKFRPGRAAALRLFVDVLTTCEKNLMTGDFACLLSTLPEILPKAAAAKKAFPNELDVDRAVLFFTMFAKDHALAAETLAAAPSEKAAKSREMSLDRARAAATVASVLDNRAGVDKLRATLDGIVPRSKAPGLRDPDREALEADFDLVAATLTTGPAQAEAFRKAGRSYTRALEEATPPLRGRIVSNLAALAMRDGKAREAKAMIDAYPGPKDWPFDLVKLALADEKLRVDAVRAFGKDVSDPSKTTVGLFKASILKDKKDIAEAEQLALVGARTSGYAIKAPAVLRGVEWTGHMTASLGLDAHGHAFAASAFADLWFFPLPKVRLADVERRQKK